jgi:amino acid adenylation domain-containing protein
MLIHQAVLAQAARAPGGVAFRDEKGRPVTYDQVQQRVRRLGALLRRRVGPVGRVAVLARKSPDAVVAMLATLDAGLSYVPVDAAAPPQRRRFIIQDAECALVLVDPAIGGTDDVGAPMLALSAPVNAESDREFHPAPDDEAYVLYTSGSTGTPKGVVITHRNAAAFVTWAARTFALRPDDQVAVHAPLHFDLPVYDIYVGLAAGATLHLVPERTALFPQALWQFLTERQISCLYAVPSALTALYTRSALAKKGLPALRQLLYAGEEFRPQPLRALMAALPQATVANLYGPIETNVITSHTLDRPPAGEARVPIGRPVDGVLIALLGEDGSVSLDGSAEGEIIAVGDCVTPGYLNRADLTAAATLRLDTPAGAATGYRTGDFARRDVDGLLHLLGRRDGLVKTRGYRVELGEVEAVIGAHPAVAEIVVLAEPHPELTHRLHAVIVAAPDQADGQALEQRLTAHCRERLPAYMVPASVHVLPDLPRTSTGKVARADLLNLVLRREAR